ncbi:MAG: peptide ABC transporter ATP-binding protein, partial [Nitriliruptorales bacterium]|nr:peptide ABC transporter ATP-binding protein [Nitriliruptorales bacterium]
ALDPELVGDVLTVLKEIAEEGNTTMMLVTHEMGFAREVADRVVMFDHGRILEDGTPEKILRSPEHERTQSFLQAVLEH